MKLPPFDIIGNIAIADIPEGCDEKTVAKEIIDQHKRVTSVYKKASGREGVYRTRKLMLVSGRNKCITLHKENGLLLRMNIRKVYFSPREGTERLRLAEKVCNAKPGAETGMVFFSGIGALPILLSKRCDVRKIIGIEINSVAVKYFLENIAMNKVHNVSAIQGDVKKEARRFYGKCDFVIMPLPETGWKFISHAIRCIKPGGICFFYAISDEKELYKKWEKKIVASGKNLKRKIRILETRKVLPYAARKWKVRIDFQAM